MKSNEYSNIIGLAGRPLSILINRKFMLLIFPNSLVMGIFFNKGQGLKTFILHPAGAAALLSLW